jgi:hypothetical protein
MTPILYFKKSMLDNMFFKRIEASKKMKTAKGRLSGVIKSVGIVSVSLLCLLAQSHCPLIVNKISFEKK